MLRNTLLFIGLVLSINSFSQFTFLIEYKNKIDTSRFIRSESLWIYPTPFGYVHRSVSFDRGYNWEKVGLFGKRLRPYVINNPVALKNLNAFRTTRIIGLSQILIISPTFMILTKIENDKRLKEMEYTNNFTTSNYIWGAIGSIYTGLITYHLISKIFLNKTMSEYYNSKNTSIKHVPIIGLSYNSILNKPTISLCWNF